MEDEINVGPGQGDPDHDHLSSRDARGLRLQPHFSRERVYSCRLSLEMSGLDEHSNRLASHPVSGFFFSL